jgi:hypothetical protein
MGKEKSIGREKGDYTSVEVLGFYYRDIMNREVSIDYARPIEGRDQLMMEIVDKEVVGRELIIDLHNDLGSARVKISL